MDTKRSGGKSKLSTLLKWAKRNYLYIEICGDGSVTVEEDDGGGYVFLCEGETLYAALHKARTLQTR